MRERTENELQAAAHNAAANLDFRDNQTMRILSTVGKTYVGHPEAVEPMFLEFTIPLRRMGHDVEHYDHMKEHAEFGPDETGARFERLARYGHFDLILYQTAGRDYMNREAIAEVSTHTPIIAWNSDDDWQWESYTRHIAPWLRNAST